MQRAITFDSGEKSLHLGITNAHPYVISGGSPGRIRRIAKYLANSEIIESDRGLVTVHGLYQGVPITAFSTGMGPASVSITLPEVIEACDTRDMYIIRLGTAGALKRDLNVGDFIVTTFVDRQESTSVKISSAYRLFADRILMDELETKGLQYKSPTQKVHIGPTRVVDEIYINALAITETPPGGPLAVSMEFSVYCALRNFYNTHSGQEVSFKGGKTVQMPQKDIKVGNLLVISDNPLAEGTQVDMTQFHSKISEIERTQILIGLEALVEMSKQH